MVLTVQQVVNGHYYQQIIQHCCQQPQQIQVASLQTHQLNFQHKCQQKNHLIHLQLNQQDTLRSFQHTTQQVFLQRLIQQNNHLIYLQMSQRKQHFIQQTIQLVFQQFQHKFQHKYQLESQLHHRMLCALLSCYNYLTFNLKICFVLN